PPTNSLPVPRHRDLQRQPRLPPAFLRAPLSFFPRRPLRPPTSTLFPYTTLFRSDFDEYTLVLRGALRVTSKQGVLDVPALLRGQDRKSTRLNSSHVEISYAVFCLKKKTKATYTSP